MKKIAEYILIFHLVIISAFIGSYADEVSNPCTDPMSGTVSSVAGGVGTTSTPNPITTTGTVELDIHNALSSTTVASGDEVPVQDVSVGNAIANQRRTTAGAIAALSNGPLLDGVHNTDTIANTPVRGDMITVDSTPKYTLTHKGTTGQLWTQVDGNDQGWKTFENGDPGTIVTIRKKVGYWIPGMGSVSAVNNVGIGACSTNGTASSSNDFIDFRVLTLAAASGSVANFRNNFTSGGPKIRQKGTQSLQGQVGEGVGDAAKYRFVFGTGDINSATHFNTVACNPAGGTENLIGFWMCYEDSVGANWQICSGDGADWDCTDTGIVRTVGGTTFEIILDMTDNTGLYAYINGVRVGPHTNKLPSTSSNQASAPSIEVRSTAVTSGGVTVKMGIMLRTWD